MGMEGVSPQLVPLRLAGVSWQTGPRETDHVKTRLAENRGD